MFHDLAKHTVGSSGDLFLLASSLPRARRRIPNLLPGGRRGRTVGGVPCNQVVIKQLICPTDTSTVAYGYIFTSAYSQTMATISYAYNWPVFGAQTPVNGDINNMISPWTTSTIPDGNSNTIYLMEKICRDNNWITNWWADFRTYNNCYYYGSAEEYLLQEGPHDGVTYTYPTFNALTTGSWYSPTTPHAFMNVAMGDGSVHAVSSSVSYNSWVYACNPSDSQIPGSDF